MSHFTVVVAIKDPDDLEKVMAPYDENLEVEPYRDYEDKKTPEETTLYWVLQKADEDHRNGTGILPYKPNEIGWGSNYSHNTPEEQARQIADKAALFNSLPKPFTWQDYVTLYNDYYEHDGDDRERVYYDAETDRAYSMSTYNPDSKWDYWRIGGRWGGYFRFKEGCEDQVKEFMPEHGWDSSPDFDPRSCDGGPKGALDLDGVREDRVREFLDRVREFETLVAGTPEALPWKAFCERAEAEEDYSWSQAREDYGSQSRVRRIRESESDFRYMGDAIGSYQLDARELKIQTEIARASAVPGYAVVTLEGKWMAPGEMGWFGMSSESESDKIGYLEVANAYIESLPDEVYLIALDCHI